MPRDQGARMAASRAGRSAGAVIAPLTGMDAGLFNLRDCVADPCGADSTDREGRRRSVDLRAGGP